MSAAGLFRVAVWRLGVLALLLSLAGPALAAAIQVKPDRDPVRLDETFTLEFSSEEDVDDDPDFSPLREDFEILGQNQGSQMSIVNGKISRTQQWTLTLAPKRAGALTIPPIHFGADQSPAAALTVLAGGGGPAAGAGEDEGLRLELEAAPKDPYVQAQVLLTVRVLMRVAVAQADLSEPVLPDALVEQLGEDRRYRAVRNGREYEVFERQYAIFPQKSGLARIEPLRLTAQVETGRSFFSRSVRPVRVSSEAVDLKVRPQPAAFTGAHWLPAAALTLEESWSQNPPAVKAGDPITRTLTLKARGATVGLLPELGGEQSLDASVKQYPDQPALDEDKRPSLGFSASRVEKTALIPGKPGEYRLPAVEVPWWNTEAERMEIARIPERILKVEGSVQTAPPPPAAAPAPNAEPAAPAALPTPAAAGGLWFWLALLFGLGWLVTALAWWLSGRRGAALAKAHAPAKEPAAELRAARKALQQACAAHDAAAARRALSAWAGLRRPGPAGLGGGELAAAALALDRALYGRAPGEWRGEALWAAVLAWEAGEASKGEAAAGLEPLYR